MIDETVRDFLKQHDVQYLLAQFVDIHGAPKAKAVPVEHAASIFEAGAGFAGFAVHGLGMEPHHPDFMAVGDPSTLKLTAWRPGFAVVSCQGLVNEKAHQLDSRFVCRRALQLLRDRTGLTLYAGLEPEFFLLQRERTTERAQLAFPGDQLDKPCYDYRLLNEASDILVEIHSALKSAGIDVYQIDHEDGNGQYEINFTYRDGLTTADNFIFVKMAATAIAAKHGLLCSFMPKPFKDRSGSGMHLHVSLGDGNSNKFHDTSDRRGLGLSPLAYQFLGGILAHAPALTAIACPTVNSYKRLTRVGSASGATWAPTHVAYGDNNRTAMVRIPYGRIELRNPDGLSNPYLLLAAVAACGLDGIERAMDPGEPINENIYRISPVELRARGITQLPGSLDEALDALERDEVISKVLGEELIKTFVSIKRAESETFKREVTSWELDRYLYA